MKRRQGSCWEERNILMEAQLPCPNTSIGQTGHSSVTWEERLKEHWLSIGQTLLRDARSSAVFWGDRIGPEPHQFSKYFIPRAGKIYMLTNYSKTRRRAPHALQEEALSWGRCHCGSTPGRGCQVKSHKPLCNRRAVCSALRGWLSSDNSSCHGREDG